MSPQQADGHKPEVTDDIYALGATLYELLTSQQPFVTGDIAYQIKHNRPQAMQERLLDLELSNEIPSELCALVMACLAKEPSQRPQSARAILDWLETTQAKTVVVANPAPPLHRPPSSSRTVGRGVPAEPSALHRPVEPPPRPRSKPPTALPAKGSTPKEIAGQHTAGTAAAPVMAADHEPAVADADPPSSDADEDVAVPESSDFPEPESTEPTPLDKRRWVLRGLLLFALFVLALLLWKNNSSDTPPPRLPPRPSARPLVTPPPAPAPVAPIAPPEPARAALPEVPEAFENLFNGRDLTGWEGDPRYWTVTNGAIFGRFPSLVGGRQANTALFYRGAPVQDFELRFLFRSLSGSYDVIYRAREQPNFFATGYACTLWLGAGLVGGSHELFQGGTRGTTREYFSSTEGKAALLEGDWNEVVITAQADRLRHEINGKLVCDARDASSSRLTTGTLALALNLVSSGSPNGIEFKDIRLKRLSPPIPAATPEVSNPVVPPAASFVSLFNGRDLAGWSGDARLWSVRNGALVGNVSRASPTRRHFLFWQGGPVNDFELRMAFRLGSGAGNRGGYTGNSGLFYWARTLDPLFPGGLEYEIRAGAVGSMYFHQDSRTYLNEVTFNSSRLYRGDTWNEAVIIARGRTLVHQLNGVTVGTKTIDYLNFVPGGYLALEINHSAGWESYVEFQYISLKRL